MPLTHKNSTPVCSVGNPHHNENIFRKKPESSTYSEENSNLHYPFIDKIETRAFLNRVRRKIQYRGQSVMG